jgi:hypothetical protein
VPANIQLAERGDVMSDAPMPGMGRLAQADQAAPAARPAAPEAAPTPPRDLSRSPALTAAAQAQFGRQDIDDIAQKMLLGQFKQSEYKNQDNRVAFARKRALELQQQIQAVRDRQFKTQKEALDAISAVSPTLGSDVRGIVTGATAPPRGMSTTKPPWDLIYNLAQKVDPNLDAATFQTRAGTLRYYNSGQGAGQLTKLGTAYDHGKALLTKLQNQPSAFWEMLATHAPLPAAVRDRLFPETSAAIAAIEADTRVFASETNSVLAYGQGTGGERKTIAEEIDWSKPNAAIARVKDLVARLQDREAHVGEGFERGTHMSFRDFMTGFKRAHPEARSGLEQIDRDKGGGSNAPVDYRDYFR